MTKNRLLQIAVLIFFLINISCNKDKNNLTLNPPPKDYLINEKISHIIDDFIDSCNHCNECTYEIIIDKKDLDYTIMGLKCFTLDKRIGYEPIQKYPALLSYSYKNIIFKVYSGTEEIFANPETPNADLPVADFYKHWCIIIDADSIYLQKSECFDFLSIPKRPTIEYKDVN